MKLIAVIKPHTGELRAVDTVVVLLLIEAQHLRMEIIDISHVWRLTAARRAAFGGRLAAETGKEGVGNRMLCASEVKNKAAKQRKQSPEPCAKYGKSRPH